MSQRSYLTIKEFARLTGIRRENLRFYDQIGLLSPETRGENGYRYYSRRQLNSAYLVSDLRELGVGLEEIKRYSSQRTPEAMLTLFAQQEQRITAEIERLRDMREVMTLRTAMAREALRYEEDALLVVKKKREPIFLCPPVPEGLEGEEAGLVAYDLAAGEGINLGYPLCSVVAREDVMSGCASRVLQYYFAARRGFNAYKPAGQYAVAYGRCDIWRADGVYRRLGDFLRHRALRPAGNGYATCLLDELSVQDPERYCIRVEIPVEEEVPGA